MIKRFFVITLLFFTSSLLNAQEKKDSINNGLSINIITGINYTFNHYSEGYYDRSYSDCCFGIGIAKHFGVKRKISLQSAFYFDRFSYKRVESPYYNPITITGYYRFIGIHESLTFNFIRISKTRHGFGLGLLAYNLFDDNDRFSNQIVAFIEPYYNFEYKINKKCSFSFCLNIKHTINQLRYNYFTPDWEGPIKVRRSITSTGIDFRFDYFPK